MREYRSVSPQVKWDKVFSICTIVNDWGKYQANQQSWLTMGFGKEDCEFLISDNSSSNKLDGFQSSRLFLDQARGQYIIMAHLDSIPRVTKDKLLKLLQHLETIDPKWAVVGNAGINQAGVTFITLGLEMPNVSGSKRARGFQLAHALDENLLIVKAEARLSLSYDLEGFHLYGLDLCDVARRLGRTCYVAPMPWYHDSHGILNTVFYQKVCQFESKMRNYRWPTIWATNCTYLSVSRSPLVRAWARAQACWLLRKNQHHTDEERRDLWNNAKKEALLFPAYALLWLYKKSGLEKFRKSRMMREKLVPTDHA
ncbi:MAG: hypothetical protein EBZ78_03340 [Verrucomicrobia bacterium]|nr:hypothetical protein [Verrucomicrobiota bacterium]